MPEPGAAIPAHVPSNLVVDWDFLHAVDGNDDPFLTLKRLHDGPDIFWTPHNKGHWVATRGEDIRKILSDHETFSSRVIFLPAMDRPRIIPAEIDPPHHAAYRALIQPFFFPGPRKRARSPAISSTASLPRANASSSPISRCNCRSSFL